MKRTTVKVHRSRARNMNQNASCSSNNRSKNGSQNNVKGNPNNSSNESENAVTKPTNINVDANTTEIQVLQHCEKKSRLSQKDELLAYRDLLDFDVVLLQERLAKQCQQGQTSNSAFLYKPYFD